MIDEQIQPISSDPDLKGELDRLASEHDVGGIVGLFDMYVAAAEAILLVQNQPRSGDTDFMEAERCQLWSKAYAVAARLRTLQPTSYDRERFVQTLFNCALQMGHNLEESVGVMNAACAVPTRFDLEETATLVWEPPECDCWRGRYTPILGELPVKQQVECAYKLAAIQNKKK